MTMTDGLAKALTNWHLQTVKRKAPIPLEAEPDALSMLAVDNVQLRRQNEHLKADNRKLRERLAAARSMAAIKREVARKHEVTLGEMEGSSRRKAICRARHEAWWLIRTRLGKSYPEIGRVFGDRDHTTILHGIRQHQARIDRGEA